MPIVFLCHASEDKPLARQIAEAFSAAGVDTFLDEWEIGTGDSFRQKIDAGISACTHFVVLLTPGSITKPWVRFELDAGVAGYLDGRNKLFPLRSGLSPRELPATLQGLNAPEIVDVARDLPAVIGDMHGVSRKPPLGPTPAVMISAVKASESGLSAAAYAIAMTMVENSVNARYGDPQRSATEVGRECALTEQALVEALDELDEHSFIKTIPPIHARALSVMTIMPLERLFVEMDRFAMPWNPEADARLVAATLINIFHGHTSSPKIASELGWTPRRLNPAVAVLVAAGLVATGNEINPEWRYVDVRETPRTKRFLRDG
ncbi:MAG: toll/interleukin-1 receptor domain-containing protein [Gemmatimonadota bacterium]